uniref:(northern house mosquito) hypothetical protein n=1 Tax=Culex pipiens TaxID=7175 RepID=A0A8D8J4W7_CULPI
MIGSICLCAINVAISAKRGSPFLLFAVLVLLVRMCRHYCRSVPTVLFLFLPVVVFLFRCALETQASTFRTLMTHQGSRWERWAWLSINHACVIRIIGINLVPGGKTL